MANHARYSPSGFEGWSNCSGWASNPVGSKDADLGTDAHELAALCLNSNTEPGAYLGRIMGMGNEVDLEMVEAIDRYLAVVRSIPGTLLVEVALPIEQITDEAGAIGTSDAVILADNEIIVIDLKYGKGIAVDAANNGQLRMYALAALLEYAHLADITHVRTMIVQPRLNSVTEEALTVPALEEWGLGVKPAETIVPGEKQCRWCAKKSTCLAVRQQIVDLFETVQPVGDADDRMLAEVMAKADMIEAWIKAVRGEVETRLLQGKAIAGWKLVQGKKGARAWTDANAVADILKHSMRLKVEEMYDLKLISPTAAEKILKPKQWDRINEFITQADGRPSVAPASDKRPAINQANVAEQFDLIS